MQCAFCQQEVDDTHYNCVPELEQRLLVLQQAAEMILARSGKFYALVSTEEFAQCDPLIRQAARELFDAIEPLHVCIGSNWAKAAARENRAAHAIARASLEDVVYPGHDLVGKYREVWRENGGFVMPVPLTEGEP
jgi:hypothetical protein